MEYDVNEVDEMKMLPLYLVLSHDERGGQAWKTFEWAAMHRLREKS